MGTETSEGRIVPMEANANSTICILPEQKDKTPTLLFQIKTPIYLDFEVIDQVMTTSETCRVRLFSIGSQLA